MNRDRNFDHFRHPYPFLCKIWAEMLLDWKRERDVLTFDVLLSSANKLTRQGVTKKDQLSITHNDMYKSCSYHRVT